jgi:hypothetical protein
MDNNSLLTSQHWPEQCFCVQGEKDEHICAVLCAERHRQTFDIRIATLLSHTLSECRSVCGIKHGGKAKYTTIKPLDFDELKPKNLEPSIL